MNNLDTLLKDRGIRNDYLMKKLEMVSSTYYRKKKERSFTYDEIAKILEVLNSNTSEPKVNFEDLNGTGGAGNG